MGKENKTILPNDLVGVIPAAGFASRISPIPCSKEIYPVAFLKNEGQAVRPRVAASYLLENMHKAGIKKAYVIIRKGKWDIPQFFGTGFSNQPRLAYLPTGATAGAPFTVDVAYPFIKSKTVAFGFPDIMMKPGTVFQSLYSKHVKNMADITLALFKANDPSKADMVKVGKNNRVLELEIKPDNTTLSYSWMAAVWSPEFTEFLNAYLKRNSIAEGGELFIGNVIQQAISEKLEVLSVVFPGGSCLDIGTREGLSSVEEWIKKNDKI